MWILRSLVVAVLALAAGTALSSGAAFGQARILTDGDPPDWLDGATGIEPDNDIKIVGGELARPGAWPWQVAIYRRAKKDGRAVGSLFCGGSLIDAHWVLTAAHCLEGRPGAYDQAKAEDVVLVEGTSVLDRGVFGGGAGKGRKLSVRRIIVHEHWNSSTKENDIALLQLTAAATSHAVVIMGQPATAGRSDDLSESRAVESAGTIATVTGWGTVKQGGNSPDQLMQVDLPVVGIDTCSAAYGISTIDGRVVCAGLKEGGRDSCQGDSGGPMVVRDPRAGFVQVGIVSWGRGCARPNSYGIYTRVSAFNDWLKNNTGIAALGHVLTAAPSGQSTPSVPVAASSVARGDRALLVGIDKYQDPRLNLVGSTNDVRNMRRLLIETYGYKPEQIMTLVDAQATRAGILKGFDEWLIGGSAPGSKVFFFMSSHGDQKPDVNGDESDGLDETLVPYDVHAERRNGVNVWVNEIVDDEIGDRIKRIPDRKVTVVIDACHSGTVTRDLAVTADLDPGTTKCLCAVVDDDNPTPVITSNASDLARSARSSGPKQGFVARSDNVVAWSAVNEGQLALVDTEGPEPQGVFTRRFIEAVTDKRADLSKDGIISNAELLEYVRARSEEYCSRLKGKCRAGLSPQLEARRGVLALDAVTGRPPPKPENVPQNTLAHGNAAGVSVDFVQGTELRVGQSAQFRVSARQPGYLVLLDITPDGKVTQIFPNARSLSTPTGRRNNSNYIAANRPLLVPDRGNPYEGFDFTVDPPLGDGRLVAVLSREPIQTVPLPERPKSFETLESGADFISQIAEELRREPVVDGRATKREWSVAIKPYRIQ